MTPDRVVRWGMTIPVTGVSLADHAALVPALAAAGYTDIRTAEVAGTDAFYAARPRLDLGRLRAYVDAGIDTPVRAMLPTPDTENAAAFVDTLSRLIGAKTAQAAAGPRGDL
jgi:hypothetical protein